MLKYINKNILTGMITLLPLLLTVYLVYWFVLGAEAFLGGLMQALLPVSFYRPGMGVVIGLLVAFSVGLLMHTLFMRRLLFHGEQLVARVPLIKSVYLSTRDILEYFSAEKRKEFEQVVAITLGNMQVVGLVTQTDMNNMPKDLQQEDSLLVYVPMSYGIGGFAVLVPRSATKPLNMSMEEAMRFTLTAGVTGNKRAIIEQLQDSIKNG
ncbi:MAG TPA: DUF502 domain-containing protein [Methylophilaceae bacterium]|nr:DUF502 domain-containing protein [Methylophilaceae bacterium]